MCSFKCRLKGKDDRWGKKRKKKKITGKREFQFLFICVVCSREETGKARISTPFFESKRNITAFCFCFPFFTIIIIIITLFRLSLICFLIVGIVHEVQALEGCQGWGQWSRQRYRRACTHVHNCGSDDENSIAAHFLDISLGPVWK